jgi:hypothetical protein
MKNPYLEILTTVTTDNKYTTWYLNIIQQAINTPPSSDQLLERHHIIPKSWKMGGESDPLNIAVLTVKQHFVVHHLLTKMVIGPLKSKMGYAFWAMCTLHNNRRTVLSKHYVAAKELAIAARRQFRHTPESRARISAALKGKYVGQLNSMYGKTGEAHHGYGKPSPFSGRTHTNESKQLMSDNNIMKRDPYAGSVVRWTDITKQEHSMKMCGSGNTHAKTWSVTCITTGEVRHVTDLKLFCVNESWNYASMMSMRSINKPYKGYIIDIL